ncbi:MULTISPECIES: ABC transporter ATP-binding protein [Streptomyces]|uniref:ABC transporter n=4 Tax=Streptomyces TaxID=1883 RepID=A0A8H9HK26_9ACTN|nr:MULTISPECIES: ABC transporter ATP-binding protein [Streptomyces]NEC15984.1 ABC transporter ATP-binding protein [Streptomyces sp. SID8014]NEE39537.1 ABC transporter ATP-binding protein [Streptomyces sp. SID7982]NEE47804.1 ABC transporter ATP-binding protein [Streptomyces sp. SID8455]MBL3803879.1 ABC transporter ATP-binding protein [Streptomyces sp. BRB081]MDQ0296447.1 iron complex transport system ATP-binding protein [Streptomyces sp. DSM 41037]
MKTAAKKTAARTPAPTAGGGAPQKGLGARGVTLSYGGDPIVRDVTLDLPHGGLTVIIGPNGCGKSTLLKGYGRILKPEHGTFHLHGRNLHEYRGKEAARHVALLPQSPVAPDGITVRDLVRRGRYPHHTLLRQWSPDDDRAIAFALDRTGLTELAEEQAGQLSGGQRQRAWIAMVLAQETELLLLDEPTTFLDIAHQYDLLELCAELNREGRTIVAVLHDLNQAARFASHLVVMDRGEVYAQGAPEEVMTAGLVREVFGLACDIAPDPRTGTPMVVPHERYQAPDATDRPVVDAAEPADAV